jgi:hypothetical protein
MMAALALAAFAQDPAQTAQCYSGAQIIQPCAQLTDAVYWASKDPQVRGLQNIADPAARETAAEALDAAGLVIDRQIDIWGLDPTLVMETRGEYGYSWVPSAFQPNLIDPLKTGVFLAGTTPTDMSKPWARSIRVSTLASDYPPIAPPKPVAPPSDGVTWNFDASTGKYSVFLAAVTGPDGKFIYSEGQSLTYAGQTVYIHINWTVFGPYPQFLLTKP